MNQCQLCLAYIKEIKELKESLKVKGILLNEQAKNHRDEIEGLQRQIDSLKNLLTSKGVLINDGEAEELEEFEKGLKGKWRNGKWEDLSEDESELKELEGLDKRWSQYGSIEKLEDDEYRKAELPSCKLDDNNYPIKYSDEYQDTNPYDYSDCFERGEEGKRLK